MIPLTTRPSDVRSVGLLAHVDAGKTTITEQILYQTNTIRQAGRVDEGTAQTDFLPIERQRGISIQAAPIAVRWQDTTLHLIDTPGHMDFSAEVERSLQVLDGAVVVVSAVEGIQAHTDTLWRALDALGLPRLLFINKIDRAGADFDGCIREIRERWQTPALPLQVVGGQGTNAPTLAARWERHRAEPLAEFLADFDDTVLEAFLDGTPLEYSYLEKTLREQAAQQRVVPVLAGSALQGIGICELLDALCTFVPPAVQILEDKLSALIYQVRHDPRRGRLAHARVFSGTVTARDVLPNVTQNTSASVTQIERLESGGWKQAASAASGDMVILQGLRDAHVGDVLGSINHVPRPYSLAVSLLSVQVYPAAPSDFLPLARALQELDAEDPRLAFTWYKETQELVLNSMGSMQLEVLRAVLAARFQLDVTFSTPSILYKETPARPAVGRVRYTMPKPCWACLDFAIEPMSPGSGLVYESRVSFDTLPRRYQRQTEAAVPQALAQGLLGWEVTDLKVALIDAEYHIEHTHSPDFTVAPPMAIMDGLTKAETRLLEPRQFFHIHAPSNVSGRVLHDLSQRRAEFENPTVKGDAIHIEGVIPAAEALDYPMELAAAYGGQAAMTTRFAGNFPAPDSVKVSRKRRGVNPLDRAKYILAARNALASD